MHRLADLAHGDWTALQKRYGTSEEGLDIVTSSHHGYEHPIGTMYFVDRWNVPDGPHIDEFLSILRHGVFG